MVGLDYLKSLFQHKLFYNSVLYLSVCLIAVGCTFTESNVNRNWKEIHKTEIMINTVLVVAYGFQVDM